jgi:hypothetical protein
LFFKGIPIRARVAEGKEKVGLAGSDTVAGTMIKEKEIDHAFSNS